MGVLVAVEKVFFNPATAAELLGYFPATLCFAVLVGVLVGWSWRPKWAEKHEGLPDLPRFLLGPIKCRLRNLVPSVSRDIGDAVGSISSETEEKKATLVNEKDLKYLYELVDGRDGGPVWHHMMERSLTKMRYQAWRRDPEMGPPQYRSSTIFEDIAPEIVKDFFWDDEFRMLNKWDDMLIYHSTLEECQSTGTMVVHWIRKFPFFCSDREYIIGRRIWKLGKAYYCITKGVPYSLVPRRNKPRRVDLYYSSWCIRPAKPRSNQGQYTATEVLLFHYEDMGIPWQIAKLGVQQGMWGCVRRIEPGLRDYQIARRLNKPLSPSALMAQINTEADPDRVLEDGGNGIERAVVGAEKHAERSVRRIVVVGAVVALACTIDRRLLTKAIIFGVARRFARRGEGGRLGSD